MAASLEFLDVVVIGAGISGLSAAHELMKRRPQTKLVVLEAKNRVGGRLDSAELKTAKGTDRWDLGGQWVSRTQKAVMNLLEELDVEIYDQWSTGSKVMQGFDGIIKTYSTSLPPLSYLALLDMWWFTYKVESLCKEVPIDDPSKCPYAVEWDGMTLESWKHQTIWTSDVKDILDAIVGIVFGATPSQMSFLYFLHYLHCAGGWSVIIDPDTKGYAQEWRIKGTAHRVTELLAARLGRERVLLNHPVTSIKQEDEHVFVSSSVGQSYKAKFVILAIPPHLAGQIEFSPRLPYNKQRLTHNMPPSHLTKFVATYATAFWRKAGLSGDMARNSSEGVCEGNPIAITFDATTNDGNPAILGFITSYAAAKWTSVKDEIKEEAILKSLKLYFGPEAEHPLDFCVKDWSKEEWNGGCPVNVMVPGAVINYGDCLRQPFLRVHWAGTESATEWRGYMNGAVQAGHRATREVLERLDNPAPTQSD